MKRNIALALFIFFALSGLALPEETKTLELRFAVDVGHTKDDQHRHIEVAPRVRVLAGKEAELTVSQGPEHEITLTVLPQMAADGLVDLSLRIDATVDSAKLIRTLKLSTPLGKPVEAEFLDDKTKVRVESFVFDVTEQAANSI